MYIGKEPSRSNWEYLGGSSIDPSLRVAGIGNDIEGHTMPYWPNYNSIQPTARATYLDWLASGRSDTRYSAGYVFLYFYGLERRFFQDNPTEDEKTDIVEEVDRLLRIYGENNSVKKYLGTFLDVTRTMMMPAESPDHCFEYAGYEIPLGLRLAIGRMVRDGIPLNAIWVLSWYCAHPEYSLRTPARRASEEFKALFKLHFDEKYPDGMKVNPPKRILQANYLAASSGFEANLEKYVGVVPDISGLTRPLNLAKLLVEEATNNLDKYSRFLGRNPDGRNTIEAFALLPKPLWDMFPSSEIEGLRQWANEIIESGGLTLTESVIERLEGSRLEKVTKSQLTSAADALAGISVGLAPDPRYALRGAKYGEPVILFPLPDESTELEHVSAKYTNLLIAVTIGTFVASVDGTVAAVERSRLESMIENSSLSPGEQARLNANLQWMMVVQPELSTVKRHLKDLPKEASQELGKVALAMTAADGLVDTKEIKALENLYSAIGLEKEGIYSALHALTSSSEPVPVWTHTEREREFTIPAPDRKDDKVTISAERVEAIKADTARVSSILTSIFSEEDDEEEILEIDEALDVYHGLDAKQKTFVLELITREHWIEAECENLASQFRLMLSGTLETVNDWSFNRFGDMLVPFPARFVDTGKLPLTLDSCLRGND